MSWDEDMPDVVQWINLLSALCFTSMCTILGEHESWEDVVFVFVFFGMILGSVIFLMGHGFCIMCGGKSAFWLSTGLFSVLFLILLYTAYSVYDLSWLI